MDAARYARVRELFLAAEEMPPEEQSTFLKVQAGQDDELLQEVMSLLSEHDPESARIEGQREIQLPPAAAPHLSSTRGGVTEAGSGNRAIHRSDSSIGHRTTRGDAIGPTQDISRKKAKADITKHGAQRTHAAPRETEPDASPRQTPNAILWAQHARQSRRRTSGWLWLAALLPTALIGWWTYAQVESTMRQSVATELQGIADSVALGSQQFLGDKAQLVQSWSRQPVVQTAINELVEISKSEAGVEQLQSTTQAESIRLQLQQLSGFESVEFAVWNDSYRTIATSNPDDNQLGEPIDPSGASDLARVMAGETVLFGPKLVDGGKQPLMAIIVPIRDAEDQVIAALKVHGIGIYDDFNRMFMNVALAGELDVYAVDSNGVMITASPRALAMAAEGNLDVESGEVAANLRVADPGLVVDRSNVHSVQRSTSPLTIAAAQAINGGSNVRIEAYKNYAGIDVVGAWRWHPDWTLGIIIERPADVAFAPARIVRFGFVLLGTLLFITAFAAAARIASTSTAQRAAVHPLSRYEILGELGSGGMGVVYRARHRQLGREAALKVLAGDRRHKEDRLRFDREARLAASLSNPHSVLIYDYGQSEDGEAYCVMELLRGVTLQEVVARSGHQAIGRTLCIISQMCDALAEAHSMNLLHRDIKPQNVMLSLDPSVGDWAVVFDYGLAKPLEPVSGVYQTSETIWSGTPMYMSPERFRDPSKMDPRSDVYSVGCVAYYLLAGRSPFIECDPESLFALILSEQPISISLHRNEEMPDEINQMVMKCMAKNADDRFESISELSRVIQQLRVKYPWSVDEARVWWKHHGGR